MSGVIGKIKNALQSEKNTPEAAAANKGNNGNQILHVTSSHFCKRLTLLDYQSTGTTPMPQVMVRASTQVSKAANMELPISPTNLLTPLEESQAA